MTIDSEQFAEHLKWAADTVASWPAWKQNVLGDLLKPVREKSETQERIKEAYREGFSDGEYQGLMGYAREDAYCNIDDSWKKSKTKGKS